VVARQGAEVLFAAVIAAEALSAIGRRIADVILHPAGHDAPAATIPVAREQAGNKINNGARGPLPHLDRALPPGKRARRVSNAGLCPSA
jgi:hypothetical protein